MPTGIIQPKTYLKTFLALLGLLALTVAANLVNLGPFGAAVAMLISFAKASLIILIFMEVRGSSPVVWLFATAGFLWLLIMLLMLLSDYSTRSWVAPDWRAENNGINHVEFSRQP